MGFRSKHHNQSVAIPQPDNISDLEWWLHQSQDWIKSHFPTPEPKVILTTDASGKGWGAVLLDQQARGDWNLEQMRNSGER